MSVGTMILTGAKDRLLPASVPFAFFAAACVFHVLAWLHLALGADMLAQFTGGPGPVLAAIHLFTLGVLALTAMGAAYQLLPVATRQPLARVWPARLSFWLAAPGVLILVHGMERADPLWMQAGGALVAAGLALFALLSADNLRRAGSLPVVTAHGWVAMAALVGLVALGLMLIWNYADTFLADPGRLAVAHMALAGFGFMGMLALGFSHILVPMFALSRGLPQRLSWIEFGLAGAAVAITAAGLLAGSRLVAGLGGLTGIAAVAAYLWLMRAAMKSRMRKRLGLSFVLVRASWGFLAATVLAGLALILWPDAPRLPAFFGFLLVVGWLMTFLTAILQRIMPFLATMHAAGKGGRPPLISELASGTPLKLHAGAHLGAVALCLAGIALNLPPLILAGAGLGTLGALSFAAFGARILLSLRRSAPA